MHPVYDNPGNFPSGNWFSMAWSTDQLRDVVCANSVSLRRKHATKEEIGVAFDRLVMLNTTISVDDDDETGMARPAAVMDAVLITLQQPSVLQADTTTGSFVV